MGPEGSCDLYLELHRPHLVPQRWRYDKSERVVEIAGYLPGKLEALRTVKASAARVLRDLVRNQRM